MSGYIYGLGISKNSDYNINFNYDQYSKLDNDISDLVYIGHCNDPLYELQQLVRKKDEWSPVGSWLIQLELEGKKPFLKLLERCDWQSKDKKIIGYVNTIVSLIGDRCINNLKPNDNLLKRLIQYYKNSTNWHCLDINQLSEFCIITTETNYGCYIIGDFYIGKSVHFDKRIKEHLEDCASYVLGKCAGLNQDKCERIKEALENNNKLIVEQISENRNDEIRLINEFLDRQFPLTNKSGVKKGDVMVKQDN